MYAVARDQAEADARRSERAARANATRRVSADIAILRQHFDGEGKSDDRTAIADFLVKWTPDEWALEMYRPVEAYGRPGVPSPRRGLVGDLQGGGLSSKLLASRGLPVLAAEDCSWTRTKLGNDRARAEAAAREMAGRDGYELALGGFLGIIPRLSTANYDPCAIPTGCVRDVIRAMVDARLVAFAVTVVLSRVPGTKGRDSDFYEFGTEGQLSKDAHGYHLVDKRKYVGTANVPMATYFFVRGRAYNIYLDFRAKALSKTPSLVSDPGFDQRVASGATAEYLWGKEKEDWFGANPGHALWCSCRTGGDGKRTVDERCLSPDMRSFIHALVDARKKAERLNTGGTA